MKLITFLSCGIVIALFLILPSLNVAGQTGVRDSPLVTFKGIVSLCQGRDSASIAACGAYVTGFVQGSVATQTAAVIETVAEDVAYGRVVPSDAAVDAATTKRLADLSSFCIRSTWTASFVKAHIVQYALEHPDLLSEPPGDQMLKVLARAFPCGKAK